MNYPSKGSSNLNPVFLLRGHDLEMLEIKKILEEQNIRCFDKNLEWGARLSEYLDVLNEEDYFIGIELAENIPLPKHYINVDHHNENTYKPSCIEQIAELLNLKLNRWQQLVAANDRGYIPTMKAYGAIESEITDIRRADRKAQGIIDEDERLAEESVRNHQQIISDVKVIFSLTNKFSPIPDLVYPTEKLIIHNEHSLVYYGSNAHRLLSSFNHFVEEGWGYQGGGPNGYVGITESVLKLYTDHRLLINMIIKTVHHEP
jgi:hypothetical protein